MHCFKMPRTCFCQICDDLHTHNQWMRWMPTSQIKFQVSPIGFV